MNALVKPWVLELVASRLPQDDPEVEPSLFARGADALVQMAREAFNEETSNSGSAQHYQVVIHVDEQALRGQGGKADLPIDTVKRLCCDGSIVSMVDDANGDPLNVGPMAVAILRGRIVVPWTRDAQKLSIVSTR